MIFNNGRHAFVTGGGGNPSIDATLYLKAGALQTLSGSNKLVTWDNSSDNLNSIEMSQTNFNYQPPYNATDSTFNGEASFNVGFEDYMETVNNSSNLNCSDGFAVYLVAKTSNSSATYGFLISRTNGTSWTQGWGVFKNNGVWKFFVNNWNSASKRVELTMNNTSDAHIFKFTYDKTNIEAEIIGTINTSGTQAMNDNVINPPNGEGISLAYGGSTSYYTDAEVSEVIFYNRVITSQEQTDIETYLRSKFNI